jgi:hypothetical protein
MSRGSTKTKIKVPKTARQYENVEETKDSGNGTSLGMNTSAFWKQTPETPRLDEDQTEFSKDDRVLL